jgi:hypothetical protein
LLGSLLLTAIEQAAISRADIPGAERRDHYLYLDEFQSLMTPSSVTAEHFSRSASAWTMPLLLAAATCGPSRPLPLSRPDRKLVMRVDASVRRRPASPVSSDRLRPRFEVVAGGGPHRRRVFGWRSSCLAALESDRPGHFWGKADRIWEGNPSAPANRVDVPRANLHLLLVGGGTSAAGPFNHCKRQADRLTTVCNSAKKCRSKSGQFGRARRCW